MPSLPDDTQAIAAELLTILCSTSSGWGGDAAELLPEAIHPAADLTPAVDLTIDGTGWEQLSAQLSAQWQALDAEALASPWRDQLIHRFEKLLPVDLLQTLITTAVSLAASQESRLQQLVNCGGAVLPGWDADDLRVLARPLAYAFRSGQQSQVLASAPEVGWQERSAVDRAKLGLAIAAILLDELQPPQDGSIL